MSGKMLAEVLKARDLESQVGEIGLHLHWATVREVAKLDQFLAVGRFQESQFRAARRFVAAHFLEAEDFLVKLHRPFEIVEPITRVQKFANFHGAESKSNPHPAKQ